MKNTLYNSYAILLLGEEGDQCLGVEARRGIVYKRLYIQWEVEILPLCSVVHYTYVVLNTFSQISLKGTLEMAIFYCI